MFTGIVQAVVSVSQVATFPEETHYTLVFPPSLVGNLTLGASVSVDGVCQTITALSPPYVSFQAIGETLRATTLSQLHPDQKVNVECAAKLGDPIGGHLLSGHVMGRATLADITTPAPQQRILRLSYPTLWSKYFFHKGFIALNGVSLTLQSCSNGQCTIHIIPHTLEHTTFQWLKVGDEVNVEIDSQTQILVETAERILSLSPSIA